MKAWLLPSLDGVEALRFGEIDEPKPGPGDVVLAVKFAALNPADRYLAERHYPAKPPLPHILGRDGIGTVVAVGSDVSGLKVGDKRAVLRGDTGVSRPGTFAQRVAVAAGAMLHFVPSSRRSWLSRGRSITRCVVKRTGRA